MTSSLNFLIVHGAFGNPQENWFPWLGLKLQTYGNVFIPQFPTPEGQNLNAWHKIGRHVLADVPPANTILIGHSTGAAMVLRMAEKTLEPFKAVFAISPFDHELGVTKFDDINQSFFYPKFDWKAVKRGANNIYCYAGDNDPYVPLKYPQIITDALGIELITIPKGGHLNAEAGYDTFPVLLDKILEYVR